MIRSVSRLCTLATVILVGASSPALASIPAEYKPNYRQGYDAGYPVGYDSGFLTGEQLGITEGTADGKAAGYDNGWSETYAPAYDLAYNTSFPLGHVEGWDQGVLDGFDEGYEWVQTVITAIRNSSSSSGVMLYSGVWTGGSGSAALGLYGSSINFSIGSISAGNPTIDWAAHYFDEGYRAGNEKGITIGSRDGYKSTYWPSYSIGFDLGYADGLVEGETQGTSKGIDEGFDDGWDAGYGLGHYQGFYAGVDYARFARLLHSAIFRSQLQVVEVSRCARTGSSRARWDGDAGGLLPLPSFEIAGNHATRFRRRLPSPASAAPVSKTPHPGSGTTTLADSDPAP